MQATDAIVGQLGFTQCTRFGRFGVALLRPFRDLPATESGRVLIPDRGAAQDVVARWIELQPLWPV